MPFTLRRADPAHDAVAHDAVTITALKAKTWPDDVHDAAHVAHVLALPERAALVAVEDGAIIGFVDGFATRSAGGVTRWEVDLLAVDAAYRGRGVGRALIAACTEAGQAFGADAARALIAVDNIASARAFARCGYQQQTAPHRLLIAPHNVGGSTGNTPLTPPPGAHLLPVSTLNYRGVWVEGHFSREGFTAARALCGGDRDIAGALIAVDDESALALARAAGFAPVGVYHWWWRVW